jgi:hypothetical protein
MSPICYPKTAATTRSKVAHDAALQRGVTWFVLKQPVPISADEVAAFSKVYPQNARPTQPLQERVVRRRGRSERPLELNRSQDVLSPSSPGNAESSKKPAVGFASLTANPDEPSRSPDFEIDTETDSCIVWRKK